MNEIQLMLTYELLCFIVQQPRFLLQVHGYDSVSAESGVW